ncbi:unnamed protein product [Miscanthus lutarioriparius]|uniref:Uncharacterized protein n=1 Tax=Miscanthus lutarioriparius TaxID=422564 RepID=A0A811S1U6_9POAL|nr:unnamed protein product [Miscanthus lutarioriparius]
MAPAFGRSISFPLSPARSSSSSSTTKKQARHVRSISLPTCRAHPLLAHLHATTRAVRAWAATAGADPCTTTSTPSAGLAHLDALHAALAELLVLPEPRAALATATAFSDRLLDGLLALADAHGAFRETLLDLRCHAAEAQAALRRRDAARLASAVRAQRSAEKDLARLASSARAAARLPLLPVAPAATSVAEVEVSGVLAEALAAAASASAAVFAALEAVSSAATAAAASASSKKPAATATLMSLVTRSSKATAASDEDRELAALEKMERLDECIAEMEAGNDKVFRTILHARVALLNIRTQTW